MLQKAEFYIKYCVIYNHTKLAYNFSRNLVIKSQYIVYLLYINHLSFVVSLLFFGLKSKHLLYLQTINKL